MQFKLKGRGFYEPMVEFTIGDAARYISNNDKKDTFRSYYKRCYYCGDAPKEVEDIIHLYENVAHYFCVDCCNVAILRSDGKRELFCEECRDKRFSKI